ncbi:MAG: DUF4388 domain-containing protein [Trueperaceae bacterium]|nr:DUF4388 domain-containing protein [Trueperaceae bacterium]
MKANFQGELAEGVIANLMQYLALNRASGQLQLRHRSGQVGNVFFEQGRLVHATTEQAQGIPVIAQLIQWREGRFGFRAGIGAPAHTIRVSLDSLLLQAAYEVDVGDQTPVPLNGRSVLVPVTGDESLATVSLSLRALHVLRHIDGQATLEQVAQALNVGLEQATEASRELLEQGIITLAHGALIDAAFVDDITRLSLGIMGPVADVIVEDTLYELGLSAERLHENAVAEFIDALGEQFPDEQGRRTFEARARRLCREYGIDI